MKLTEKQSQRFWSKAKVGRKNKCWNWKASKTNDGYGRIQVNKENWLAHRLSWTIHNGRIPKGMHVLHKCDNPACINPSHLFLGSHLDNMRDKTKKGRGAKGEKHGRSKLTKEQAIKIFYDTDLQKNIAKKHGINSVTVSLIKSRKRWKHIMKFL